MKDQVKMVTDLEIRPRWQQILKDKVQMRTDLEGSGLDGNRSSRIRADLQDQEFRSGCEVDLGG